MPPNRNETPRSRDDEEQLLELLMNWANQCQYEEINTYLEAHPDLSVQMKQILQGMVLLSNFRITSEFGGKKK